MDAFLCEGLSTILRLEGWGLGQKVSNARLGWFSSDEESGHYPATVRIGFANTKCVYVTLGVRPEGDDHIEVMFSDEVAMNHGRLPRA